MASSSSQSVFSVSQQMSAAELPLQPLITCRLCFNECHPCDMFEIPECKCIYCTLCLKRYLTLLIEEGCVLVITCPDAQCLKSGTFHAKEIESLVEKEVYDKYLRFKFSKEVELDPYRTFCPEVGCESVCHVCPSEPRPTNPAKCPSCGLEFCPTCKAQWHGDLSCDKNQEKLGKNAGVPFHTFESSNIKRCPLCHVPIEREDGCAQMMCKSCQHVFCWFCLTSLDDDFLLRHYDKGPCKDKLGHSRASLIWHRAQVIGIFALMGISLLVASPFLLIAAPCILCCKCKTCKNKCCDEEEFSTEGGL